MKTLLQDKRVVALLVLAAILAVGWRVKGSWSRLVPAAVAGEPAAVVVARETAVPNSPPAQPAAPATASVLSNLTAWPAMFPLEKLDRDPFGPLLAVAASLPAPQEAVPADVSLVLQAISVEPGKAFAVINRQVLAVGESVGPYVIESINATEVVLRHPAGRKQLQMDFALPARSGAADSSGPKPGPQLSPKS